MDCFVGRNGIKLSSECVECSRLNHPSLELANTSICFFKASITLTRSLCLTHSHFYNIMSNVTFCTSIFLSDPIHNRDPIETSRLTKEIVNLDADADQLDVTAVSWSDSSFEDSDDDTITVTEESAHKDMITRYYAILARYPIPKILVDSDFCDEDFESPCGYDSTPWVDRSLLVVPGSIRCQYEC